MLQEIFPMEQIEFYDLKTDCLIKCRQLFLAGNDFLVCSTDLS